MDLGVGGWLEMTPAGLYCAQGEFYIDPWRPVDRAIVTHAHSDHARWGMGRYLCAAEGEGVMAHRLGPEARIDTLPYGASIDMNGVRVSLHPAGHILGSAQVRIEYRGRVVVVSGDYKTEPDTTCTPFEPVRCHTFITESTFGLPIYRWPAQAEVVSAIHEWWLANQAAGKCSFLFGYALGKCQRALALLNPDVGPIFVHGAVQGLTEAYRRQGISLPPTHLVSEVAGKYDWTKAIVLAPPSAEGTPWMRRFGDHATSFMSGWMAIRGTRRRRNVDRGFVISDHVDWPSLLSAIDATGAESVWVTHGYTDVVTRYLRETGRDAHVLRTQWEGEGSEKEMSTQSEGDSDGEVGGEG